jgi:transglutaminase-like putative cysteine protease
MNNSNTTSMSAADRRLQITFLISIGILTSAAGLLLAAGDSRIFPAAFTPCIAAVALYYVDHRGGRLFSTLIANLLGLVALAAAARNFTDSNLERLTAGTDFLVMLTWVVLGMQKTPRQYWWLVALSVLQVTTAGVLNTGVGLGAAIFLMSLLTIWTLAVFSLYRAALSHNQQSQANALSTAATYSNTPRESRTRRLRRFLRSFLGLTQKSTAASGELFPAYRFALRHGLDRDPAEVWIGWRFRSSVFTAWIVSVVVGMFVFAAFPRVWVSPGLGLSDSAFASGGSGNRRAGFSGSVQLGQTGSLLQSNRLAVSLEVKELANRRTVPIEEFTAALQTDELRLRGVVFSEYRDGRWLPLAADADLPRSNLPLPTFAPVYEVNVTAASAHERVVLAPYPIVSNPALRGPTISLRSLSNTLTWSRPNDSTVTGSPVSYSVECPSLLLQPDIGFPFWSVDPHVPAAVQQLALARSNRLARQLFLKPDLSLRTPRLHQLARDLCRNNDRWLPEDVRLQKILNYISPENGFQYSLEQPSMSFNPDPIERFLFDTRSGHCEYFASAAVLMLQAAKIPARLVTGYSGCELNPQTQKYEISDRHAHAWGEAWIGGRWVTLDPTPATARVDARRQVAERSLLSGFQAALTNFWKGSVNSMNAERQRAMFAPVLQAVRDAFERVRRQGIWPFLKEFVIALFNPESGKLTLAAGIVWILATVLAAFLVNSIRVGAIRKLLHRIRDRLISQRTHARSVIRFYSQFCELCEKGGLQMSASSTALENASAARTAFKSRLEQAGIADLPDRVANAFNLVRFGNGLLTPREATQIAADLLLFSNMLSNSSRPMSS